MEGTPFRHSPGMKWARGDVAFLEEAQLPLDRAGTLVLQAGLSKPVQAPDNKGVTSPKVRECCFQPCSGFFSGAPLISIDLLTACLLEGMMLQVKVLLLG